MDTDNIVHKTQNENKTKENKKQKHDIAQHRKLGRWATWTPTKNTGDEPGGHEE